MTTRQKLAILLEDQEEGFLSGSAIADQLHITRAAVWKNIRQLEEEGYVIEAVNNRGYRLAPEHDVLSEHAVRKELESAGETFELEVFREVESTNNLLKDHAQEYADWHTAIADHQISGKGRRGRSFFSPSGSGIYLSMLIRLPLEAMEATRITTAAAVAACRAIEKTTDARPEIKWVNDVFVNGKKICGILTEASISMESGRLDWAVMGIGLNVYEPEGGFPEELQNIAGAITSKRQKNLRSRLAAAFMEEFRHICSHLDSPLLVTEYKKRSFILGLPVNVLKGEESLPAIAEDIDDNCALIVRYPDGSREALSSGEVSIRI